MSHQPKLIIGVDPGERCGLSWLDTTESSTRPLGQVVHTQTWHLGDFATMLRRWMLEREDPASYMRQVLFAVERPTWYGGSPGRAVGFGKAMRAFGYVTGVLAGMELRWSELTPPEWRKALGISQRASKEVGAGQARLLVSGELGRNPHERDASCVATAAAVNAARDFSIVGREARP